MANNEQVEKFGFNALVALRAGSEIRKVQEEYLARLLDMLMAKHFGRDIQPLETDVIQAIREKCSVDEGYAAVKEPKGIVFYVAKKLLDDPSFDLLEMRSKAIEFMRAQKHAEDEIQRTAGI